MTATWAGVVDDDLTRAANYQGNVAPQFEDVVLDNGGLAFQPVLASGQALDVASMTVTAGALTINGTLNAFSGAAIGATGSVTINSGGSLVGAVANSGSFMLSGASSIVGNVETDGSFASGGQVSGRLTIGGGAASLTAGSVAQDIQISAGSLSMQNVAAFMNLVMTGGSAYLGTGSFVGGNIAVSAGDLIIGPGSVIMGEIACSASTLTNAGTVHGAIRFDTPGGATFANQGSVKGVRMSSGDDLLENAGAMAGRTRLGAGNDTLDGAGATKGMRAVGQAGDDLMIGSAGRDGLDGGNGNDTLEGGGLRDTLNGEAGHDRLDGGASHDLLSGGTGRDTLIGGGGADTLLGGSGADRLTGGGGADHFVFEVGDGRDVIADLSLSQGDRIVLGAELFAGLSAADLVAQKAEVFSNRVVLNFDTGDTLILQGLSGTAGLAEALDLLT